MKAILSVSALPPSSYRQYVKGWNKDRYAELFAKYNGDRKGYRIYIPLKTKAKRIVIPKQITEALHSKGYVVDDYGSGLAVQKDGKRKMRIGKLLPPELQQVFANDPARQAQASDYLVVISRHPYDIAGMSTGRGWRSCMNVEDGSNRHYVERDIKSGSLVAYLVKASDPNISNPSARILLRVYKHLDKTGLWPSRIYGTAPASFTRTVSAWCSQVNTAYFKIPEGVTMSLLRTLYQDDVSAEVVNAPVSVQSAVAILATQLSAPVKNASSILALASSMLCFDGPAFMRAATKLPPKKFAALEDAISSASIVRRNFINGSVDAESLFSDADLFDASDARTRYAMLWLKFWAPVIEDSSGINQIPAQLIALALEFASDVKIRASEFSAAVAKFGVKNVESHYIEAATLYAYKKYGLTAEQAVKLTDYRNIKVDPKKVDSALRDALVDKLKGLSQTLPPGFAELADRDTVFEVLTANPLIQKSSAGTRIALDRCTKDQIKSFIQLRGGIKNLLTNEFQWSLTKWRSYVGGLVFKEVRSGRMSTNSVRRIAAYNAPLFYCAPQNAKLTDSDGDIEYCATVVTATRGNYRRTMDALDNDSKVVPFANSARVLTPLVGFAGLDTPAAQIAARHLPQLLECPVRNKLLSALNKAARALDDFALANVTLGALRLGNPVLLLPFAIGAMQYDELSTFHSSVAAYDPSIQKDQIIDVWNYMHS